MKIGIWSDIMCPFCYIGKRKFEKALAQFSEKDKIELVWKSYQLSPDLQTDTTISIHEFLSRHKGISTTQAKEMNDQVTQLAANVGLVYNFDKAIVANSLNAHRFTHFAKEKGKQNEAEEKLFQAYFTDGKNIDDFPTLIQLGADINLDTTELQSALESGKYTDAVKADIAQAYQLGVRGVPFFVFDRKYAVSGAQEVGVFFETLEKSFSEWKNENTNLKIIDGTSCTQYGECD